MVAVFWLAFLFQKEKKEAERSVIQSCWLFLSVWYRINRTQVLMPPPGPLLIKRREGVWCMCSCSDHAGMSAELGYVAHKHWRRKETLIKIQQGLRSLQHRSLERNCWETCWNKDVLEVKTWNNPCESFRNQSPAVRWVGISSWHR